MLVTGAAGFVGRAVVLALAERGIAVRAGVRHKSLPPELRALEGVTEVPCDLAAPQPAAAEGATAIVHAAYGGSPARMAAESDALFALAQQAQLHTIVSLSSIDVYGERRGMIAESDAPVPPVHSYGQAKLAMEAQFATWAAADPRRSAVALRTSCVVAADSYYWVELMLRRMALGVAGPMGRMGEGFAPLVARQDVANACVLAAEQAPKGFVPLNIDGGYTLTWNEYFVRLAEGAGMAPPPTLTPAGMRMRALLSLPAKAWRRTKLPGMSRCAIAPRGGEMRLLQRKARFDTQAAAASIGWRAEVSLEALLAEAASGGPPVS